MHPPAVEEDTRQCAFSLTKLLNIWLKLAMYFLETQPMLSSCFQVKMEKYHSNILFRLSPGPSEGISTSCINETILPNSRTITRDLRINLLLFTQ